MTLLRLLLAASLLWLPAAARAAPMTPAREAAFDAAVRAAVSRTGAQGLAAAIVEEGRPVLVRAWGVRNAKGQPLTPGTVMYGASLTKAVFAWTVMQLVDEGRLDLDRSLAAYLPRPLPDYGNLDDYGNWGDLKGDERWRRITARHVLTHSTGWANFAFDEPDGKLRFHADPGARYIYSGEGMELLQFVLEEGLGLNLGAEMRRRVFAPLRMDLTDLVWRADFARNLADGWTAEGRMVKHDDRGRVRAAGSMDTTITDMARFAAAFARGEALSRRARGEMVRPQLAITTASQFPNLQPEAPPHRRIPGLAAGLGLVVIDGPQGRVVFKGGHNDSTGNMMVCVERGRRCVVLLANDVRAEAAFPELVRAALGETGVPWRWEYPALYAPE